MCRLFVSKAERALDTADRLLAGGDYEFVSSRAYYALYYAVQAALCSQGITLVRHTGALSEFGRVFVKPGTFPRQFSKHIHRLFENRHLADYDVERFLDETTAREDVEIAKDVVDAIRDYLRREGILSAE